MQTVALVLLTVILILTLRRHNAEVAVVLSIAACCMVALAIAASCVPVLDLLARLRDIADADGQMIGILCKVVGISLIAEIAATICADSGNAAMGKMLQLLAAAVNLCLAVPVLGKLMDLVESILGRL